jgi:hypothetical protein
MFSSAEESGPIELHESSRVISYILLVLYGREPGPVTTANECKLILDAADKYDFLHVAKYLGWNGHRLLEMDKNSAWEVLKMASRVDDEVLAKAAVSRLTFPELPSTGKVARCKELDIRYYCAILAASERVGRVYPPQWTKIGTLFVLEKIGELGVIVRATMEVSEQDSWNMDRRPRPRNTGETQIRETERPWVLL